MTVTGATNGASSHPALDLTVLGLNSGTSMVSSEGVIARNGRLTNLAGWNRLRSVPLPPGDSRVSHAFRASQGMSDNIPSYDSGCE